MNKLFSQTRAQQIKKIIHAGWTGVTPKALQLLERQVNTVWTKYGIYFVLDGIHFKEQIYRVEHTNYPIGMHELNRIFSTFTRLYHQKLGTLDISQYPDYEYYGVIREDISHINIGFVLRPGVGISGYPKDIMIQTILRKENFGTSDPVYHV